MHKNAEIGQLVRAGSLGTVPLKSLLVNPLIAGVSGTLLEPSAFLTAMVDNGPWDYKWKDKWQAKGTVVIQDGKEKEHLFKGKVYGFNVAENSLFFYIENEGQHHFDIETRELTKLYNA